MQVKTTLTRKAHQDGAIILSDDINFVVPEGGSYYAHAVPFSGEFGRTSIYSGKKSAFVVKGIVLLNQAQQLIVESVGRAQSVSRIMVGSPFINTDEFESDRHFENVVKNG